jgi:hypothetical protein
VSSTRGCRLLYKLPPYERDRASGPRCRSEETAFSSPRCETMSRPDRMISVQEVRRRFAGRDHRGLSRGCARP